MHMKTQVDDERREVSPCLLRFDLSQEPGLMRLFVLQVICLYKLIAGKAKSSYGTRESRLVKVDLNRAV